MSKASSKLGVPVLLLFLVVGMFFGVDGLGIQFDSIRVAQAIGTVALCIILFSGGMGTKFCDIKPVLGSGITLATLGVLITALISGGWPCDHSPLIETGQTNEKRKTINDIFF